VADRPKIRRGKHETDAEKKKREKEIMDLLDNHEGFHKTTVYYQYSKLIPTDKEGKFLPYGKLKPNTVHEVFLTYTRQELIELIQAGFIKVEELS
jgi:hypothetical protein